MIALFKYSISPVLIELQVVYLPAEWVLIGLQVMYLPYSVKGQNENVVIRQFFTITVVPYLYYLWFVFMFLVPLDLIPSIHCYLHMMTRVSVRVTRSLFLCYDRPFYTRSLRLRPSRMIWFETCCLLYFTYHAFAWKRYEWFPTSTYY